MIKRLRFFHESDCFFYAVPKATEESVTDEQHIVDCATHMDAFVTKAFQQYNESGNIDSLHRAINRIRYEYKDSFFPVINECRDIALRILEDAIELHKNTYK